MQNLVTPNFNWVIYFEEMASKLTAFRHRQKELIDILRNADVEGLQDQALKGTKIHLDEIDPFTFTSLICKHGRINRSRILAEIRGPLGISAKAPTEFSGVPNVQARQAWLFPYKYERLPHDIDRLWDLYEQVVAGEITDPVLYYAKSVRYAGTAKLTQAIFRAAPSKFFPVDGQTTDYLTRIGIYNKFKDAREYQRICEAILDTEEKPFVHSYLAWLTNQEGPQSEAQYQEAVLKKAQSVNVTATSKGGDPVPPKIESTSSSGYKRNTDVAAQALKKAKFQCEIDHRHATFVSSAKGVQYVEAHHLVPMSRQPEFSVSLDVVGNIVALCPTCHRLLHHGKAIEKKGHIRNLFKMREHQLELKEIKLTVGTLLNYYRENLLLQGE